MTTKNSLQDFKHYYEYHEDLPEITKMVRRAKDKIRKKLIKKREAS